MAQSPTSSYLRTRVMTASPQQLRLMLYEGAIRFCRQARHALTRRDLEPAYNAIVRAQKIVMELSTSLNHEHDPELCSRLASLYTYIYRLLVDANMQRDTDPLDEAERLLDYQRETWVLLMRKISQEGDVASDGGAAHDAENPIASIGPASPGTPGSGSFSAEG